MCASLAPPAGGRLAAVALPEAPSRSSPGGAEGYPRAVRTALLAVLALLAGCGGPSPAPTSERSGDAAPASAPATALPEDLPERLEVEYRRRAKDGGDLVLKLTPAGARYGLAHGKARVALRYQPPADALASVYATLRQEGFDGIETVDREGAIEVGGTSLRVFTGTDAWSVTAMGRRGPAPDDAQAYARTVAAMEALVPAGRSDVVVLVRWDASMRERNAGLDVDVGADLVGVHRVAPPGDASPRMVPEAFELHLARPRPLQLQLRQASSSAPATTLTVQAGIERGVELAFDAARGEVIVRPLSAAPTAGPAAAVASPPASPP